MSKRMVLILVPVNKSASNRANTSNMHKFINRIPCDAKDINRPGPCLNYVRY